MIRSFILNIIILQMLLHTIYTEGQEFSARDKMIVYSECMDLLDDYQRLVNRLSGAEGKGFDQAVSAGESLIELFINRKVLIYNDLDPQHQLSEYYELETYTSNLVMWYPDGMHVQLDLENAKTGDIRKHDEGLYSTDILINKKIQGNYLNKSFNSNSEELIFRIAFVEKNRNFSEFKIVGIRDSKSTGFLNDEKALYRLKSVELSENDKEKILNGIRQLLNDYQRSLLMMCDPNEPDDEKSFYSEAFLKLFPDEQVKIYNDLEEDPEKSIINVSEYLDNYLRYYPEGIRNLAINIDSAEFGDVIAVDDDQFFSYVYADKFFSGKFQNKSIFRLSTNLVFKITLDKIENTFTNFRIGSIDRSGLSFYETEEQPEQVVIPGKNIITVNRRGFHFSPFVIAGYSEIVNKNMNSLSLEEDYHQWDISYSFAFSGGINVDYFPWDRLGIGTGLEYNRYSGIYSLDGRFEDKVLSYDVNVDPYYKRFDSDMDSIVNMSYLNIPIQLTYFTNNPDKMGFYIKSGIRFSLFLDGNYKYRGNQYYWGYYPNHPAPGDSILIPELGFYVKADHEGAGKAKRMGIAARFSIGMNIPTGYFSAIYFGPVFDIGISSISVNNGNYYDIFSREHEKLPTHINYVGWEIGMRFY